MLNFVFVKSYIKLHLFIILICTTISIKAQLIPDEEFRAVWVTTAFNIDWPSSAKLTSDQQKQEALIIFETLNYGLELTKSETNCTRIKAQMISYFEKGALNLEYLEVANSNSLRPALSTNEPIVCCIAAHCGEVRLIDNMEFTTD